MKIQDFLDCHNCQCLRPESRFEFVEKIDEVMAVTYCAHDKACERLWKRWESKLAEVDS